MNDIELVLFDLDGVLIDSKENMRTSWSAVQMAFGIKAPFSNYFSKIGRPFFDILELIGIEQDVEKIKSVYDLVSSCRSDLISVHRESIELLRALKSLGLRIGIVTSKNRERTEEIVSKMGIAFDVIDSPAPGLRGKPSPDPLKRAMACLKVQSANTIYVGDMDVDFQSSRAAGVHHIHVAWGYGHCPDADFQVTRASEILPLLKTKFSIRQI